MRRTLTGLALLLALAALPSHGTDDDHGGWGDMDRSNSLRAEDMASCGCRRVRLDEIRKVYLLYM